MFAAAMNVGATDLFWIFIMPTSLQPMLKKRLLEASRHRLITKIERKRGARVILLAHRQETMSFLGFPIVRYIHAFGLHSKWRRLASRRRLRSSTRPARRVAASFSRVMSITLPF